MHVSSVIIFVGLLVFLAHLFNVLFSRTKVPDVLMLIIIGLGFGPATGLVTPEDFGAVGTVFVTIALVVILFEGGMGLKLKDLHKTLGGMLALTLATFIVTVLVVVVCAYYLTDLGMYGSLLLGAILGAVSPAVVIPLARQLNVRNKPKTILSMESAISEVLCIVVAIALLEAYKPGEVNLGFMFGRIISSFLVASIIGVLCAVAWSTLLHKVRTLENSLFTTPAFVFIIYGVVETLGYSGAIASLLFGITLGNIGALDVPFLKRYVSVEPLSVNRTEKIFFSEVVFLLKTFFFFYVGISIQLLDVQLVYLGALITVMIFAARVPVVGLTVDKATYKREASIMSVMVPKGLASAVVASIPLQLGVPGADVIQNVTYIVVLLSIVLTSVLIFLLDKTSLVNVYGMVFSEFKETPRAPSKDAAGEAAGEHSKEPAKQPARQPAKQGSKQANSGGNRKSQ